jgi:hypothetical protein
MEFCASRKIWGDGEPLMQYLAVLRTGERFFEEFTARPSALRDTSQSEVEYKPLRRTTSVRLPYNLAEVQNFC